MPSTVTTDVVLLVHSDKAFDCVESNVLFAELRWFGLGVLFILWIPLLCTSIHTNDIQSNVFSLSRGNFNLTLF